MSIWGVGCRQQTPQFLPPGDEQTDTGGASAWGGRCSRRVSCGDTTGLRDISPVPLSTPCMGPKLFSHHPFPHSSPQQEEKTHNYFLAFLGDGLAVDWEISTSCSFLRAGRCYLGDWRGAWLSVAAHCRRLFLSLLPSAFFFFFLNAFLLFPDLGRADPAVSPGDCSGFRRIWFQ